MSFFDDIVHNLEGGAKTVENVVGDAANAAGGFFNSIAQGTKEAWQGGKVTPHAAAVSNPSFFDVLAQVPSAVARTAGDVLKGGADVATGVTKLPTYAFGDYGAEMRKAMDIRNADTASGIDEILHNIGVSTAGSQLPDKIAQAIPNVVALVASGESGGAAGSLAESGTLAAQTAGKLKMISKIAEVNPTLAKTLLPTVVSGAANGKLENAIKLGAKILGESTGFSLADTALTGKDPGTLPEQIAQNTALDVGGRAVAAAGGAVAKGVVKAAENPAVNNEAGFVALPGKGEKAAQETAQVPAVAQQAAPVAQEAAPMVAKAEPVVAESNPIDKLTQALKDSKKLRPAMEAKQAEVLKSRVGQAANALESGSGQAAFNAAKSKLKGGLLSGEAPVLQHDLTQADLDSLFNTIRDHGELRPLEKIRAADALSKIFEGKLPQRSEAKLLTQTFGAQLVKTLEESKSGLQKFREGVSSVLNIPRAIQTSVDFSAPFRQGLVLYAQHPVTGTKSMGEMFKQAFSQKMADEWMTAFKTSPEYARAKDAGLYISETANRDVQGAETGGELIDRIPIVGQLAAGSERAYSGFLNKLRVDVFNDVANKWEKAGVSNDTSLASLAHLVNTATGRGELGKFEKVAPELSNLFFSPRLMASRINMMNPMWYKNLDPLARKEATGAALATVTTGLTILGLAQLAGAKVEANPLSSDFGKIQVGNQRWDIWGGFSPYARVAAQIITGKKMTNGQIADTSRLDTAVKFARSKLAPVPSTVVNIGEGKDVTGNPVTPASVAVSAVTPLAAKDLFDAAQANGLAGVAAATPSLFGVGYQNYSAKSTSRSSGGSGVSGAKIKLSGTRVKAGRSKSVRISRSKVRTSRVAKVKIRKVRTA